MDVSRYKGLAKTYTKGFHNMNSQLPPSTSPIHTIRENKNPNTSQSSVKYFHPDHAILKEPSVEQI